MIVHQTSWEIPISLIVNVYFYSINNYRNSPNIDSLSAAEGDSLLSLKAIVFPPVCNDIND